jgi:hypothetical protein
MTDARGTSASEMHTRAGVENGRTRADSRTSTRPPRARAECEDRAVARRRVGLADRPAAACKRLDIINDLRIPLF